MKKRIIAFTLVLMICLAFSSAAFARGALSCQSNAQSGNSYATLRSFSPETLYIQFSLYKIENSREVFQCSASNNGSGTSVTARSTKALSSGSYVMYIYGTGDTVTYTDTRYYTI